MCKLHTDSRPRVELNPDPWRCEAAVLTTEPPCHPLMIAHVQDMEVDTCLISLDQKKAFDRISHTYMRDVLSKMGFGEGICNWIQLLYTNSVSAVSINGWESKGFPIRSEVRQGCPLSSALFVHGIEPFAESIRKDASLRGITIPGSKGLQVKASRYVDDNAIFHSDPLSVSRLISTRDQFELASGIKVNWGKSKSMFIGNWADQSFILFTIRTDYLTVLGIWFGGAAACAKTWEGIDLASLPQNAPSSCSDPYHLSFVEKFVKKNTFDPMSIRQCSAHSMLETLLGKGSYQVAPCADHQSHLGRMPCHQDIAWLVDSELYSLVPGMNTKTNIGCARRVITAMKDCPKLAGLPVERVDLNRVLQAGRSFDISEYSSKLSYNYRDY
eukprot:g37256.t1